MPADFGVLLGLVVVFFAADFFFAAALCLARAFCAGFGALFLLAGEDFGVDGRRTGGLLGGHQPPKDGTASIQRAIAIKEINAMRANLLMRI